MQAGPITMLVESAAAAVGAGILLGGFGSGVAGVVLAWPKKEFEARVLRDGYIGGVFAMGALIADIVFRYAG